MRTQLLIIASSLLLLQLISALSPPVPPPPSVADVFPLRRWAQEVPRPSVIKPSYYDDNGIPVFNVRAKAGQKFVHPDLEKLGLATPFWGYNGEWPGPTFDVVQGQPIRVNFINELSNGSASSNGKCQHFLPIDRKVQHSSQAGENECKIVTHLHGAEVGQNSDGYPDHWQDSDGNLWDGSKGYQSYYYNNEQRPFTTFYHDHTLGVTRLNVYAGLAGFYLLRGEKEAALNLPSGEYEQAFLIQDRSFKPDGSLFYPDNKADGDEVFINPEYFGDHILVNGVVWPYKTVERRAYRFRILNACNSRFITWKLARSPSSSTRGRVIYPKVWLLGRDHGFFNKPIDISQETITLAPSERLDIVMDFFPVPAGEEFVVVNEAGSPYPDGDPAGSPDGVNTFENITSGVQPEELLLFKVSGYKSKTGLPTSTPPAVPSLLDSKFTRLVSSKGEPVVPVAKRRRIFLSELVVNDRNFLQLDHLRWSDEPSMGYDEDAVIVPLPTDANPNGIDHTQAKPLTEAPHLGEYELWTLVNPTADTHPIHTHPVSFQVVSRQAFNTTLYEEEGKVELLDDVIVPKEIEQGWKDVVMAPSGFVTTLLLRFNGHTGVFPVHCHILEHEDNEMMRRYNIENKHGLSNPYYPRECKKDNDCLSGSKCVSYTCTETAGLKFSPLPASVASTKFRAAAAFTARLTKQPLNGDVSFYVHVQRPSDARPSVYSLQFSPANWNIPQVVSLTNEANNSDSYNNDNDNNNNNIYRVDFVVKSSNDYAYEKRQSFTFIGQF